MMEQEQSPHSSGMYVRILKAVYSLYGCWPSIKPCTRVFGLWYYQVSEFYSKYTCGLIWLQMTAASTTDDSKYTCIAKYEYTLVSVMYTYSWYISTVCIVQ